MATDPRVFLLMLPIALLFLAAITPSSWANQSVKSFRWLITRLAGMQLLATIIALIGVVSSGSCQWTVPWQTGQLYVLYADNISMLMLAMVSLVGTVTCVYSVRYLDGEPNQGRYFRWMALTLAAVTFMVITGNLLLFVLAWAGASVGLHRLLLHYPTRSAAQRAAWTKFGVSRVGDCLLLIGLGLTWNHFGTWELPVLFAAIQDAQQNGTSLAGISAIAWCFMLGAAVKSAQFPFHGWLPETLETPTPVSALMHAGIVNAGGYLIIRLSPILTQAPAALFTLAFIGAFTAGFAGVVMLTQTSVKRSLAYSTIAQMGFMMLQCGLGAFSAAMLHILAHSLYKAHAFLNSGSGFTALDTRPRTSANPFRRRQLVELGLILLLTPVICLLASRQVGFDFAAKPGGWVLLMILSFAVATWAWRTIALGRGQVGLAGGAVALLLCGAYLLSYSIIDWVTAPALANAAVLPTNWLVIVPILGIFALLGALHLTMLSRHCPSWLHTLQIHVSNGFYVNVITRRLFFGHSAS